MRVIAGELRGRKLAAPPGTGTRPTSDRVREATFSALISMGEVQDAVVLDAFAGSGALGIEALSRGAARCTFVERDRDALAVLRANLEACGLGADRATVVAGDGHLAAGSFDLALLDPPYRFDGWNALLSGLDADVAVCESAAPIPVVAGWAVAREKAYGATVVSILRRLSHEPDDDVTEEGPGLTTVLYPGSFDPFHNGHRELVETAAYLFEQVVVGAIRNPQKGDGLFDLSDREAMISESLAHLPNIRVVHFSKLVVEVAEDVGADVIVKGLRAVSDAESEITQAQMNLAISGVHTIFIPSASASSFLASKLIREVARLGGDVSDMVPDPVAKRLKEKFGKP